MGYRSLIGLAKKGGDFTEILYLLLMTIKDCYC